VKPIPALLLALTLASAIPASAIDWPEHYAPVAGTLSPDGRLAIIAGNYADVPADNKDHSEDSTYLADVTAHKVIGEIKGGNFYSPHNHLFLSTYWAADDSWCVATYDERWNFFNLSLLKLGGGYKQIELGATIDKACKKIADTYLAVHVHWISGTRLEILAIGTDNPQQRETIKTQRVIFRGAYDIAAEKWLSSKARAAKDKEADTLEAGLADSVPNEEETPEIKRTRLDQHMNEVYKGLRALLPPKRFEALQKEQREWLAGPGKDATNPVLASRNKVLDDLLWSL